jgi:hypothetical protein
MLLLAFAHTQDISESSSVCISVHLKTRMTERACSSADYILLFYFCYLGTFLAEKDLS